MKNILKYKLYIFDYKKKYIPKTIQVCIISRLIHETHVILTDNKVQCSLNICIQEYNIILLFRIFKSTNLI